MFKVGLNEPSPWSAGLKLFVGRCSGDAAFAQQVRACAGPSDLLALAQAGGLALDPRELRRAARELRAVCFPWNGPDGDASYRRDWFERDAKISK
jgi:hypothetical protein